MEEKALPCFKGSKLPGNMTGEMDRQLAGQQQGLNNMTVQEYLDGRTAYQANGRGDPSVARTARSNYQDKLTTELENNYREAGETTARATELANSDAAQTMSTLAALHNPDQVAGGANAITDFGGKTVNSTIGGQWASNVPDVSQSRVAILDAAARGVPAAERSTTLMKVKLERCQMTQDMDEDFKFFYENQGFGPAESSEPVSEATLALYRGKLPDQMLQYWKEWGFCSFGKGIFWTVNPSDYVSLVELWLEGTSFLRTDSHYVVGRSAFGKLYLWGTASGENLTIDSPWGMIFPRDQTSKIADGKGDFLARRFFGGKKKRSLDQEDSQQKLLFDRALATLGQLRADEMYGFEPALALGGPAKLENLRKVKTIPHFAILAQLGERKVMRDIVQDARAAGLMK